MKIADYYTSNKSKVKCTLCPQGCVLEHNQYGKCNARKAFNGELLSENYGKMCSMAFDPIEKKPLYHYFPGHSILSIGTIGCNLHCDFCQNWEISQAKAADFHTLLDINPAQLIETAKQRRDNVGIAYTYNEPVIWFEFVCESAALAHSSGLKNVMVTNGYINSEPLNRLLPLIDAFNVDLKAFDDDFYQSHCNGRLAPVLDTILRISKAGKHLEITNLIIPGLNDDEKSFSKMLDWIVINTSDEIVMHLTRYMPNYKSNIPKTPEKTLLKLYELASEKLPWVYLGNITVEKGRNTICPECSSRLINRQAYIVSTDGIDKNGCCRKCGYKVVKKS